MDPMLICVLVLALAGVLAIIAVVTKRRQIEEELFKLQHPPTMITSMTVSEAMSAIRGVLKNQIFHGQKWSIRDDNPNGMIIAVLTFDEDIANRANIAKRQLIFYLSVKVEGELTKVFPAFNAYSTFGRFTTDAIIRDTTAAVVQSLTVS